MEGHNNTWPDLLQALATFLLALTPFVAMLVQLWRRDNATDARLDNLWNAHIMRGEVEVVEKRLALAVHYETDDPMKLLLKPEVVTAYKPIAPALRELRQAMPTASPGVFAEAVEKRFGGWLTRHICPVIGVSDYACLAMARVVADTDPKLLVDGPNPEFQAYLDTLDLQDEQKG